VTYARRPRRRSEPVTAADLVNAVVGRLGGEERAKEHQVFEAYQVAAGPMMGRLTEPEALRGNTLYVRTASSAIAHQLCLLRGEIIARLAETLGPEAVTDVRTRVGPLRAKTER
jgi:hypothetical protein